MIKTRIKRMRINYLINQMKQNQIFILNKNEQILFGKLKDESSISDQKSKLKIRNSKIDQSEI